MVSDIFLSVWAVARVAGCFSEQCPPPPSSLRVDGMDIVGEQELQALREVIRSQRLCRERKGNAVNAFEEAFAGHIGRKYLYALNSGTSANEASLIAAGVRPGDEVICPPCSFIATSLSAVAVGAIPVFADVDPRTLILDPDAIESKITKRTKAVVVVHLFGQPARMDRIVDVARANDLKLVEDCAQAYDATFRGRMVGTFGDVSCFSLQQSKHITAGEGGMIATDDEEAYRKAVLHSNIGLPSYRYGVQKPVPQMAAGLPTRGHLAFGHNHRMSELQASVALVQLGKIAQFNQRRAVLAGLIAKCLGDLEWVQLAHVYPNTIPNWWEYPIRLRKTARMTAHDFCKRCEEAGFSLSCYKEVNYLEAVYQEMNHVRRTSLGIRLPPHVRYEAGICPEAEKGASRLLSISCHHASDPGPFEERLKELRKFIIDLMSRK